MDEFRSALRNTLEQMVSVKTVGLHVGDDTSQAVMEVVITPRVDQGLVFDASAKLKCQDGSRLDRAVVEAGSGTGSVHAPAKMSPTQATQIKRVWGEKIREYFQDFRNQRMKLVKAEGAQE